MAQLHAVGARSADRLSVDLLGSGGAQLLHLRVNALAVRYRGLPDYRSSIPGVIKGLPVPDMGQGSPRDLHHDR
jgi:hypothetical protein